MCITDWNVRLRGEEPQIGVVEVKYRGMWGRVIDHPSHEWTKKEANVVCRELGYNQGFPANLNHQITDRIPVWMANVTCTGSEASLQDCSYEGLHGNNWPITNQVSVVCVENTDPQGAIVHKYFHSL